MGGVTGSLNASQRPYDDNIAMGSVRRAQNFHKFGLANALTAAAGEQTIWPNAALWTPQAALSAYTITYTPASDGATATGARVLLITYLDSDFALRDATHVLGSSGSEVTAFQGWGIQRAVVVASGGAKTNVAAINFTAGSLQAMIAPGISVTQQMITYVPIGATYLMEEINLNLNKVGGAAPITQYRCRVYNFFVDMNFVLFNFTVDASVENNVPKEFHGGFPFGGRDVIHWTVDTDTNSTITSMVQSGRFYNLPSPT